MKRILSVLLTRLLSCPIAACGNANQSKASSAAPESSRPKPESAGRRWLPALPNQQSFPPAQAALPGR